MRRWTCRHPAACTPGLVGDRAPHDARDGGAQGAGGVGAHQGGGKGGRQQVKRAVIGPVGVGPPGPLRVEQLLIRDSRDGKVLQGWASRQGAACLRRSWGASRVCNPSHAQRQLPWTSTGASTHHASTGAGCGTLACHTGVMAALEGPSEVPGVETLQGAREGAGMAATGAALSAGLSAGMQAGASSTQPPLLTKSSRPRSRPSRTHSRSAGGEGGQLRVQAGPGCTAIDNRPPTATRQPPPHTALHPPCWSTGASPSGSQRTGRRSRRRRGSRARRR